MRLPLRHAPPSRPGPRRRCGYLEALAEQLVGVPLSPAAAVVASKRSRGRHGNALQWHLGLSSHDADAGLDWEDRIEIKLVSVWRRRDGSVGCDKLKVSDIAVDPWRKLGNVLWVFVDRLTRVVVDAAFFHLDAGPLERLAHSWRADPHFDDPPLFVEARESEGKRSPAYYLHAAWFAREGLLPPVTPSIFPFDARWWGEQRAIHGHDPLLALATGPATQACPRCGGPLRPLADPCVSGFSPAWHGMPLGERCAVRGHAVIDASRLRMSPVQTPDEFRRGVEGWLEPHEVWRLADRVPEPEDHGHR